MKFVCFLTTVNSIGIPTHVVRVFKRIHRHPITTK